MSENSDESTVYKVVTANRLSDGVIVYLRALNGEPEWTEKLSDAAVYEESEIDEALSAVKASDTEVIEVYDMEVASKNKPLSAREKVRAKGPTIKFGPAARQADFDI